MSEEINAIKDKRQWETIAKIEEAGDCCIEAYTGWGKTEVASKYIKKNFSDKLVVAVVPRQNLRDQLLIKFANIKNFHCYVINSFTMSDNTNIIKDCDLLWVDEVHWCLGQNSKYFNTLLDTVKRKKFLGTSATLSIEHKMFLASKEIKIVDSISIAEGIKLGTVPSFFMYNLPVQLTESEKIKYKKYQRWYDSCFKVFDYDWNLVKECTTKISPRWKGGMWQDSPQAVLARELGWVGTNLSDAIKNYTHNKKIENGVLTGKKLPVYGKPIKNSVDDRWHPENIRRIANIWMGVMQKRKWLIECAENKIPTTIELLNIIKRKSIVFSSTQDMASRLAEEFNKNDNRCLVYHTKVKKKTDVLIKFSNSKPTENLILSTVKAADEGIDIKDASLGIQQGYNSNSRVYTQRVGRLLRIDELNPNKVTLFINLYVDDFTIYGEQVESQEKKWLMKAQKGQLNVKWFDNIEELKEEIYAQL